MQNSLGRTLTLTNTSGRITAVGDGSLNRGQTQTNANGKLYTYYFAGSRSEELELTDALGC